jgi:hypothetical protein
MGAAILCQGPTEKPGPSMHRPRRDRWRDLTMGYRITWGLAALLACAWSPLGATPGMQTELPKAANASRTPEKRAEKQPKPRKSKRPARSSGAASAAG